MHRQTHFWVLPMFLRNQTGNRIIFMPFAIFLAVAPQFPSIRKEKQWGLQGRNLPSVSPEQSVRQVKYSQQTFVKSGLSPVWICGLDMVIEIWKHRLWNKCEDGETMSTIQGAKWARQHLCRLFIQCVIYCTLLTKCDPSLPHTLYSTRQYACYFVV